MCLNCLHPDSHLCMYSIKYLYEQAYFVACNEGNVENPLACRLCSRGRLYQAANKGSRAALEWRGMQTVWDVCGDAYWHVQQVNMSAAGEGCDRRSIDLMLVHKHSHAMIAVHVDGKQHECQGQRALDMSLDAKILRCWRGCRVVRLTQAHEHSLQCSWVDAMHIEHALMSKGRL